MAEYQLHGQSKRFSSKKTGVIYQKLLLLKTEPDSENGFEWLEAFIEAQVFRPNRDDANVFPRLVEVESESNLMTGRVEITSIVG